MMHLQSHSFLPPVPSAASYTRSLAISNAAGSTTISGLSGDESPEVPSTLRRWAVFTTLNFAILWLFIKEFGLAAALGGALGFVQTQLDK